MVRDDLGWPDNGGKVVGVNVLFPWATFLLQVFRQGWLSLVVVLNWVGGTLSFALVGQGVVGGVALARSSSPSFLLLSSPLLPTY